MEIISNKEFLMAFGLNLRNIHKTKNLKQYHVAERCGIHKNNYTNIERGNAISPFLKQKLSQRLWMFLWINYLSFRVYLRP